MKMVIAYIRPEQLQRVKQELYKRELYSMSITNILDAGRQGGYATQYRGVTTQVNLLKKLRIEICVNDDKLDMVFEAITEGARTGRQGDGVIFACDTVRGERIRTGESL